MSPPDAIEREPPWMLIARAEIGTKELPGKADNPRIVEYLATTRLPDAMHHDETPWCSAFCNWVFEQLKFNRTRSASARSWLSWGVTIERPTIGCVVVLSRPSAGHGSGHVGFYAGEADESGLLVLGGNQGNQVSIKRYPKARVLGYRTPV